jgi:pyruvate/2-oxoglutarate dehydrogenase complex dihydrolipoamide acyltransferase (E2) component
MRRAIAEHMVRSVSTAPHVTTVIEVDMTPIVRYRERAREEFERREGVPLTYMPFVIGAVVEGLKQYPIINSTWTEQGVLLKREINIGVAVGLEDGLIVPVIRNADEKSLVGLARAVHDLATRARENRLRPEDVQGGTFTVNNPGTFGTLMSTPVISQPQAAILSTEAITKRPVVTADDAIAIRSMMYISFSFDHRVLDGMQAARFLGTVKQRLEGFAPEASGL